MYTPGNQPRFNEVQYGDIIGHDNRVELTAGEQEQVDLERYYEQHASADPCWQQPNQTSSYPNVGEVRSHKRNSFRVALGLDVPLDVRGGVRSHRQSKKDT